MGPYPISSLPYDLGFFLLALALFRGAALLAAIQKVLLGPPFQHLMSWGGWLLLASVAIHVYASLFVLSPLSNAAGSKFDALFQQAIWFKHTSLAFLSAAGLCSTLAGLLCYRRMNR